MDKLTSLREKIEKIDEQIGVLLTERYKLVRKIGIYKQKNKIQIRHKQRENFILTKVCGSTKSPAIKTYLNKVFGYLLKISRNIQR